MMMMMMMPPHSTIEGTGSHQQKSIIMAGVPTPDETMHRFDRVKSPPPPDKPISHHIYENPLESATSPMSRKVQPKYCSARYTVLA